MTDPIAEEVIAEAYRKLHSPYVLGAEGPTRFDCSGLMYWIFRQTGHEQLIGNSRRLAAGFARWFADRGKYSRNLSDARRGDLICYTHTASSTHVSHIGIYLGEGRAISALIPPFGVREHGVTSIDVAFDGVCLVDYPSDPGRTGPDDTDSQDDDPEVFVSPTTPRWHGDVQILYEGTDITADVKFDEARFVTESGGVPGECQIKVRDKGHVYLPGYFHTGGTLELWINGRREWDGWAISVSREYAFAADDTEEPQLTPRWWVIDGFDRNFLFTRRFHLDKGDPTNSDFGTYPAGAVDADVVRDLLANYTTLDDDGLDLESGIEIVGPIDPFEAVKVVGLGMQWGEAMRKIGLFNGAIHYIDPDRVVRYVDDASERAPFALSDQPAEGEIGYRELMIHFNAGEMYNEAFLWGVGVGSATPAFAHVIDEDAVSEHGLFQYGETVQGMYKQDSVSRRADTLVNGSPSHQRGHKLEKVTIECVVFQPGLRVGEGVSFRSAAWEFGDYFYDPGDIGPSPTPPPGGNEFEQLLYQIGKIESNNTYDRQNKRSFAYGRWQVMPGNWKVWACLALGIPRSAGIASRDIPPDEWYPPPTPANQDATIRWRMGLMYQHQGDVRRVAASWKGGASVGSADPSTWSRGVLFYVNHATVPLGYPPTTNDTVLAPLTEPTEARDDFQEATNADGVYPVRRMEITFPTPHSVRYALMLSHSLDAAWAFQDPYPSPNDPPPFPGPGGFPMTEVITMRAPGDTWSDPQPPDNGATPGDTFTVSCRGWARQGVYGHNAFVFPNEVWVQDGADSSSDQITPLQSAPGVYSSIGRGGGIQAMLATVVTNPCATDGWTNWEDSEQWYGPISAGLAAANEQYPLELRVAEDGHLVQGYVPSVQIGVAHHGPEDNMSSGGSSSYGTSNHIGECINLTGADNIFYRPDWATAYGTPLMPTNWSTFVMPIGTLTEGDWITVSPGWQCQRLEAPGLICDTSEGIWGTDPVAIACSHRGPQCTGSGQSGLFAGTGPFQSVALTVLGHGTTSTPTDWTSQPSLGSENGATSYWVGGQYRTLYPYQPGSLEVTWQGVLLTRGVEYVETDPANGLWTINQLGSGEGSITIRYWVPDGASPTIPGADEPWYSTPIPGDPTVPTGSGRVYRPRGQRQFGWGTPWDSTNCNMTTAAMALDRHTLGAFSDIAGTPRSTPPNMRFYSGRATYPPDRLGTSIGDASNAWDAGWGQTLITPGPVSWEYFKAAIQSGRGGWLHGLETVLPPYLRKTDWPDAHAIYINEVLPDGSFWGFDPLYREPLLYPESALRAYATSLHGFNDVVTCALTRITPEI